MSILKSLSTGQGYLKAGFLGMAASGKTHTAMLLAMGLRQHMQLGGPIVMYDTEAGSQYWTPRVKEATGTELLGVRSRSFSDLLDAAREAEEIGASAMIVDSITHVWRELCAAYLKQVNESFKRKNKPEKVRLEFQDWSTIKDRWGEWPDFYLNSKLHIIICGRAGYEYDFEEREDARGNMFKELVKTGTKMKVENEFGFEPSLLVEMERIQQKDSFGKLQKVFTRRATVLKDRFDALDGAQQENPRFSFFLPHINCLTPGAHAPVDVEVKTDMGLDAEGEDRFQRERTDKAILLEKIQDALVERWPGQTAKEKKAKADAIRQAFGTGSWTEVERRRSVAQLRDGLDVIRNMATEEVEV